MSPAAPTFAAFESISSTRGGGTAAALRDAGLDVTDVAARKRAHAAQDAGNALYLTKAGSPLEVPSTEFRLDEFEHVTFRTVNAALTSPTEATRKAPHLRR